MRVRREIRYSALPSQKKFHASEARFKGFSGPIGSGKSQALVQEAVRLCYQNPGRTGLIAAPTYAMLRDATQTALLEALKNNGLPFTHKKTEGVVVLTDSRARILLRSLDEYERLRGTNLAWFGVDELTYAKEAAWVRLEGRLRDPKATRLCGFAVWTPKGHDWVYRRFVRAPVDGYECVQAAPYENRHLLKQVPDFYARLEKSYDARFFAQEVLGEYVRLEEGRVYASFRRDLNVVRVDLDPKLPLLWSLDFNVNPMASVVAQKEGDALRVADEIVLRRAGTLDACKEFAKRYPHWPAGVFVFGDATGRRRQTTGGSDLGMIETFFSDLRRHEVQMRFPRSNPAVEQRVSLMNGMLCSADGEAHLFVDPHCKELIADFEEVAYKAETIEIDKDKDPARTHASDALGYLAWSEMRRKKLIGPQDTRLS